VNCKKIQRQFWEMGLAAFLKNTSEGERFEIGIYNWRLFLSSIGYEIDGEDSVLADFAGKSESYAYFDILDGEIRINKVVIDLPKEGKEESFLVRYGTGDPFRDGVLVTALSKYSAAEIEQRATQKIISVLKGGQNASL